MDDLADYTVPDGYGTTIGKCLTFAEIEGLLAAERERCAAVADQMVREAAPKAIAHMGYALGEYSRGRERAAQSLAATIRNLPPQTEGGQS